ncbi:MAG: hypothetical protein RIB47_05780 [Cyclobacteriaceae bacterium]
MKSFAFILIAALAINPVDRIAQINSYKAEAKEAYRNGDFETAAAKYRFLIDSLQVNEEEVTMNLANSYFQINDSTAASNYYRPLTQSSKTKMKSLANQQMGVLSNRTGKFEEALEYFKQALRADPTNEDARYNYEMVKKKLEEQKKQEEQKKDQNKDNKEENKDDKKDQENKDQKQDEKDKKDQEKKDQEKKDQQNKEQQDQEQKDKEKSEEQKEQEAKDKEQEKKDIPPSVSEKLKDMEMSEEKAQMILEAMKNQEIQYLQQNKRKATKPKDKSKPDW